MTAVRGHILQLSSQDRNKNRKCQSVRADVPASLPRAYRAKRLSQLRDRRQSARGRDGECSHRNMARFWAAEGSERSQRSRDSTAWQDEIWIRFF
jgi:hypothetical protein